MEVQKVIVDRAMSANIKCPLCGNIKSFEVGQFKGKEHNIKVKCTCEAVFPIIIDFRKSFRKGVSLPGYYSQIPKQGAWSNMNVVNLSMTGLAMAPIGGHGISTGDELIVKFILKNAAETMIEKSVRVVAVKESHIGCEFADSSQLDKVMGQFLMAS